LVEIKENEMKEQEIGYVSKFFGKISVAAIEITAGKLNIGDTIHIKGYTTDFKTEIGSMQVVLRSPKKFAGKIKLLN
jgi:hypothetical protein